MHPRGQEDQLAEPLFTLARGGGGGGGRLLKLYHTPLQVASIGLASFALVLALVEQIVLEVIESNVKRGSIVYEEAHVCFCSWTVDGGTVHGAVCELALSSHLLGARLACPAGCCADKKPGKTCFPAHNHGLEPNTDTKYGPVVLQILVLAWAFNRKDLEVVWKILSQVRPPCRHAPQRAPLYTLGSSLRRARLLQLPPSLRSTSEAACAATDTDGPKDVQLLLTPYV